MIPDRVVIGVNADKDFETLEKNNFYDLVELDITNSKPFEKNINVPKINSSYAYGQEEQNGQGLDLATKTVSDLLGIPVHYAFKPNFLTDLCQSNHLSFRFRVSV